MTTQTRFQYRSTSSVHNWIAIAALTATAFSTRAFASGEETFKTKCAACHGADGAGSTVMGKKFKLRDLRSSEVQSQTDAQLQAIIANGKSPMPAFGKTLDASNVQELVAFIRSIAAK